MSSLEELRLEGCEVVGDNKDVTGNGDNGKGLKGLAPASMGECVHAYGDTSVGGVGNPEDPAACWAALAFEALKALAMAAMATAATALPEPWGTGIKGGGTGKWVKAWLEDVAEHGVRRDECVTRGLFGAVCRPPL